MASSERNNLTIDTSNANLAPTKKSPVPPDSPLLRPSTPSSPGSRRARELQREARKARNFRASLDRSGSRSRGGTPIRGATPTKSPLVSSNSGSAEISFSIKPSVGGRKGWKIMPTEDTNVEPDPEMLQRVIDMIHEMEFSGRAVPERITMKV